MSRPVPTPKSLRARWITGLLALALPLGGAALAQPEIDPGDATWHIGLNALWGEGRNLDIYPVFEDGKWDRALATARRFNTSIHLIPEAEVEFDGTAFKGTLEVILTPDPWVPADGQTIDMTVEIEGRLRLNEDGTQHLVGGTYVAQLQGETVRGNLGGGVGATEPNWENARWTFRLNPTRRYDDENAAMVDLNLGVADGQVHWGTAGVTRRHNQAAPRTYPVDVSDLSVKGGTVTGTVRMPYRVIHPGGDADLTVVGELRGYRVQGLNGARLIVQALRDGEPEGPPRSYHGRGGAGRGGGREVSLDALWRHDLDDRPWVVPVADHVPPEPGEHPRLLFRRGDLPALRQKAQTEQGQAILQRLRYQLNAGDGRSLPAARNPNRGPQERDSADNPTSRAPIGGAFTMFHAAGYGFLWQITGDEHYARLGRECVQLMLDGQRDRDNRYSFRDPRGGLRAGVAIGAMALAYDLLYDSWDADFRKTVTQAIGGYAEGGNNQFTLSHLVHGGRYMPGSNHWGMYIGGGALATLALHGNPEVENPEEIAKLLQVSQENMVTNLTDAFGDLGFFPEGDGTGVMSSFIIYLTGLQAWRTAGGLDFMAAPRENIRWLVMRWPLLTLPHEGRPIFPTRGGYGHNVWSQGVSGPGVFSFGFGVIPESDQPALLWLYNRVQPHVGPYETGNEYPYRAIGSFLNWPIGVEEANPATVLPKAAVDTHHGHFVHRKGWEDGNDVLVTFFTRIGHHGYIGVDDAGQTQVWGLGLRTVWRTNLNGAVPVHYEAMEDGSGIISLRRGGNLNAVAVDFSDAHGAEALIVAVGRDMAANRYRNAGPDDGPNSRVREVRAGGHTYVVLTLQNGAAPEARADGDGVRIGNRLVLFDGEKMVLGN